MADSTLDSQLFVLIDNWPGYPPKISDAIPTGGFAGTTHHNVAAAKHEPGKKMCVWNDANIAGQEGMSTFIYLQLGTQDAGTAMAVKSFVAPDSGTLWYRVTNDALDCVLAAGSMLAAVALGAMTNERWGWFWCGGACPESFVSGLAGNYETEGNVAAGALCIDAGITNTDGFTLSPVGADTEAIIGYALAADA